VPGPYAADGRIGANPAQPFVMLVM